MEWNAKPPLQWEWENAAAPASKATQNTKICQPTTDWGSLISYQGDCGSGVSSAGTSFDLGGYASMSKSTSMSSSIEDIKLESVEEAGKKDVVATAEFSSPTLESSVCSREPLLSLKLGKRAYFEDISDGSNSNFPPLIVKLKCPPTPDTTTTSAKRIRSSSTLHNTPAAPCCQVEGCNLDLSSAKDYHRKHKVCANHSKSPKVIVNGVARRFCQQCSRFHGLTEFDENKRSCRKRLTDHNARRRRPHHPNGAHFNTPRLSTIVYGGLQQVTPSAVFSRRIPLEQSKSSSSGNRTWSNNRSSSSNKLVQHAKAAANDDASKAAVKVTSGAVVHHGHHHHHLAAATHHGNMLLPNSSMRRTVTVTALSDGVLKGGPTVVKIHGGGERGGSGESLISSSSMEEDTSPKDLHRALSLLSNDAYRPRSISVAARDPAPPLLQISNVMVKPWMYGVHQSSPPLCSGPELQHAEQWLVDNSSQRQSRTPPNHHNNNYFENSISNFQEYILLSVSEEGGQQHEEFGF